MSTLIHLHIEQVTSQSLSLKQDLLLVEEYALGRRDTETTLDLDIQNKALGIRHVE